MKKTLFILLLISMATPYIATAQVDARSGATVGISTGENYVNEVYFKLGNTEGHSVPLNEWDIAFCTELMHASILTNSGTKVMLYTYSNGTIDDFASVDTTGMEWTPMYNSITDWKDGAFNRNRNTNNQFDFGWGTYDMTSHNVVGDSLFIIKLGDNDYRKIAIVQKNGMQNQWVFKYANLDGSNEVTETINAGDDSYANLSFIHYSLKNENIVMHENDSDWHLLFTRYYDYNIPYYVSGVLSNQGVDVQEVRQSGLDQMHFNQYDENNFGSDISTIGSDWKSFDMTTYQYTICDTVVYFLRKGADGDVWKVFFKGFGGSENGEYVFIQQNISASGIENSEMAFASIYPNPATDNINIIYDINGKANLSIFDINGKLVYSEIINHSSNLNKHMVNVSNLSLGTYQILIRNNRQWTTHKFTKQ